MSVEAESATPTIYDVARAAGVSIASVSRVLNGRLARKCRILLKLLCSKI